MRTINFATLFLSAAVLLPTMAHAGRVTLKCTGSSVCYYTAFLKGTQQVRNLTLQPGTTYEYSGVEVGDQFCQSSDGPNDPNKCRRFTLTVQDVKP